MEINFNPLISSEYAQHIQVLFYLKRDKNARSARPGRSPESNAFYFQFQKLGNNYNQVVKVINAHFSNIAIPHQIALPEQRTRELEALSIGILNPAKRTAEWLLI